MIGERVSRDAAVAKKKSYHHGDLRNAIIAEATARARVDGEKAIILREIAPQLGVSATAAYRHFTNRQQLVEEVSARGFEAMAEWVDAAPVDGAERDPALAAYVDLRNAATGIIDFTAAEAAWARMMIETFGRADTVMAKATAVREMLQAIVDRGIEAGVFRPEAQIATARVFWVGVDGLCAHAMFRVIPMGDDDGRSTTSRAIGLCMSDLLTEEGLRLRDSVELPDGIVTELPR